MLPLSKAARFKEGVHKWKDEERAVLDAFFHLYRLARPDVEYILSTFQSIADEDAAQSGQGPTRRLILDSYDALTP